jgi:magnesium transporter
VSGDAAAVRDALAAHAIAVLPHAAAIALERGDPVEVARSLAIRTPAVAARVLAHMVPERAAQVLAALGDEHARVALSSIPAPRAAAALQWLEPGPRADLLARAAEPAARELRALLAYPPGTAGALTDPRVITTRKTERAGALLERLRAAHSDLHAVHVVDDDLRLIGSVPLARVALAAPTSELTSLVDAAPGAVVATTPRDELVEYLTRTGLSSIAVVDAEGALIGVLRHAALVGAAEVEAVLDLQRMVGASVDEKALSPATFAVRKRLPWLHVNLLTAFLAAAVVGLFEHTIAMVSALAVLMPVVAGQSGNSGAQAMAVTMRGLALREVRGSHWRRIVFKEMAVGATNGAVIAVSAGAGVLVWSGSVELATVIAVSMIVAMAAANLAGASIPLLLHRFGQDPAQSASIFLTTVTDVVGFSVFLGLATLMLGT